LAATPTRSVKRTLLRDRRAMIGIVVVVLMTFAAVAAPVVARHDPISIDLSGQLRGPSGEHWLGTDVQGRDVWARLIYGTRVSLVVGFVSQGIALLLGVTLGLLAGFYGRWVDETVMRLADVTLAFPTLLLLIAMVAALEPSLGVVFVTIGVVGWAGMARLVRGQVLVVRQLEYVQAIRAMGGATGVSWCGTSCLTSSRPSSSQPHWESPVRSWPRPRSASWDSGSSHRRRAGAP
jgi:ABC-type dipeptide/oligopeptide/nickel transport system permease subunit